MKLPFVSLLLAFLLPSCFQKVETGDIFENQLTRNRFQVLDAHFGSFYIDSIQTHMDFILSRRSVYIDSLTNEAARAFKNLTVFLESWLSPEHAWYETGGDFSNWSVLYDGQPSQVIPGIIVAIRETLPHQEFPIENKEIVLRYVKEDLDFIKGNQNIATQLANKWLNDRMAEWQREKSQFNQFDTYFVCSDSRELKPNFWENGVINANRLDKKLYKKIN